MIDDREIQPDIPADNGRRARVLKSGEVRGSGAGAGGGQPGEDLDSDAGGGDGVQHTGATAATKGTPAQGAGDREHGGLRTRSDTPPDAPTGTPPSMPFDERFDAGDGR